MINARRFAFIGNSLPRRCGIATFTTDLQQAVATSSASISTTIVAMTDRDRAYAYPETVGLAIMDDDLGEYVAAADYINKGGFDAVSLQHEFGIFGGPAGGHILALLRELRMPVVTTLHTVLRESKADQRRVMDGLITLSARLVVMAERGRQMLAAASALCRRCAQLSLMPLQL